MKVIRRAAETSYTGVYEEILNSCVKKYVKEGRSADIRNVQKFLDKIPGANTKKKLEEALKGYAHLFVVSCTSSEYADVRRGMKDFFKEVFKVSVSPIVLKVKDNDYNVVVPVEFGIALYDPNK